MSEKRAMSDTITSDFLVEIGTEELPPKVLKELSESFMYRITIGLAEHSLSHGNVAPFATPRRLAVCVNGLADTTPSKEITAWGPPTKVAFDSDGNPSRAAEAFASKNGIALENLKDYIENDGKQDKLCYRATEAGRPTVSLLADIVESALAALPIPKRMRWGTQREEFVRPVHWIVMLFGDSVVDAEVMGLKAGNTSRGHRFHSSGEITINSPASYAEDLRKAYVITDFAERRQRIYEGVLDLAEKSGGKAVISDDLLDEVTALNEWPVPLAGKFEERVLAVPAEALISSMKEHQKYFHVVNSDGKLMPLFITVANIESRDSAQVINGNERVIRPRLADAAFFYETDLKTSLENHREALKKIVFQAKLGSIYDKTERIASLAEMLAPMTGADPQLAVRAAKLSKSDLVSEMVGEFDDLQGVMGRYYALNDDENAEVAEAMLEQYMPAFSGDRVPSTAVGATVALADRLDTLAGIFSIGQQPSGSRDPFALRRASLGILRIIIERNINIDLASVLIKTLQLHGQAEQSDEICEQVLTYVFDRFTSWYKDEGIAPEVYASVAALKLSNPTDIHARVNAVNQFSQLPEAISLSAANKRVANILAKNNQALYPKVDTSLLQSDTESFLYKALQSTSETVIPLLEQRDYTNALKKMATLRGSVDQYFDHVMVMVEEENIRTNRLTLLKQLRNLFLQIADISHLVPSK